MPFTFASFKLYISWVWWYMPRIQALRRLTQEDHTNPRPAGSTEYQPELWREALPQNTKPNQTKHPPQIKTMWILYTLMSIDGTDGQINR